MSIQSIGSASDIEILLAKVERGDSAATGRLFHLTYAELRRIAHARLRYRGGALQLETTALVHETYLRLVALERLKLSDRTHFLAYAARVMRSVVVDLAREHQAERRGGGLNFVTLRTEEQTASAAADEVLQVHEALQELATIDARLAQVVELRYFGGLEHAEIAQALGISPRSVDRAWRDARVFLYQALKTS